jgi:hypothetical protein
MTQTRQCLASGPVDLSYLLCGLVARLQPLCERLTTAKARAVSRSDIEGGGGEGQGKRERGDGQTSKCS